MPLHWGGICECFDTQIQLMTRESHIMAKQTAYDVVTNTVLAQLEEVSLSDYTKPFFTNTSAGLQTNIVSGNAYKGINQIVLMMLSTFTDTRWATYKQWKSLNAQVRKGESGTKIIFFKMLDIEEDDGSKKKIPFAKVYTVFNAEQVDGAPELDATPVLNRVERVAEIDQWLENARVGMGLPAVKYGQSGAYYNPALHYIGMPDFDSFVSIGDATATCTAYGTLFHEFGHATGHTSQLDRDQSGRFGSADYGFEELVAELTATFACAAHGLEQTPRPDHAIYLKRWMQALRDDSKAIYRAAKLAQAAYEHLDSFSDDVELQQAA